MSTIAKRTSTILAFLSVTLALVCGCMLAGVQAMQPAKAAWADDLSMSGLKTQGSLVGLSNGDVVSPTSTSESTIVYEFKLDKDSRVTIEKKYPDSSAKIIATLYLDSYQEMVADVKTFSSAKQEIDLVAGTWYLTLEGDYAEWKPMYEVNVSWADIPDEGKQSTTSNADKTKLDINIDSAGIATITGTTTGTATFSKVYIDGISYYLEPSNFSSDKKSVKKTVDTKKLDIGYHELSAGLSDGTEVHYPNVFPAAIYDVPTLAASNFETYSKGLTFTVPSFNSGKYDYYLSVKKSSEKNWDKAALYGPFAPGTSNMIDKLSPNTKYDARANYIKDTTYAGKSYPFASKPSKTVTIKTGPKSKPAVKSITTSKAKVKKVWVKPLYNALGFVIAKGFWTYETTYKVTVKFKKKPGIAGLCIHADGDSINYKYLKGNKKSYSYTFSIGGKKIGKKVKVQVYTKGNKTYGANSPVYSKKVKIKK